jgi:hypothetical protein
MLSEKYFNDVGKVRYYQNASMALFDVASSLQLFLAHKSHFAVAKNGSALIESLSPIWIRNVNPLQIKNAAQHWVEFIETLHPETNFVIWASENEITGEVLVDPKLAQEIHQILSHKKVYSIQICHFIDPTEKLFPYAIKILRPSLFEDKRAFVVHSDRFKASSQIGPFQKLDYVENEFEKYLTPSLKYSGPILSEYESQITPEKNVYFNRFVPTTLRLQDRIVLNDSQVNAYSIQQELGLSHQDCFAPAQYPFWILNLWKNWWTEAENEIFIRGLFVVSLHALRQDQELLQKINFKVNEFKRLGRLNTL